MIYLLILLTLFSAFFSCTETAFFSLSSLTVKAYRSSKKTYEKLISSLLEHPKDLLVTIFMLNTLVNILLQNVASSYFGEDAGWDLKVGFPLVITLLFGEIIPKNIGMQHNSRLAHITAPIINFFHQLLFYIRKWTILITQPISKVMFFYLKKEENISRNELVHALRSSEEQGSLDKLEARLCTGYLNLQYATVKELMRPRDEILFYDINDPIEKMVDLFMEKQISRLPVCNKSLDNVLGLFSAKEFFINNQKIQTNSQLQNLLLKPFYIPESTMARTLLKKFDQAKQQIAIVVDEYGAISGLITKEDLIEEVIGEIQDPKDTKTHYTLSGKNEMIASGKLELSTFNEIMNSELSSETHMVTIGGWLIEKLGAIPKSGDQYQTDEFLFHILSSRPNAIRRVFIRKKKRRAL